MAMQRMMGVGEIHLTGEYGVGDSGRLYLPSTSANGESRRATCRQEFRIKGDHVFQNPKTDPIRIQPSELSAFIQMKLILAGLFRLLCRNWPFTV